MKQTVYEILKGDVIQLFGTKVKLEIKEDQCTSKLMKGFNAKDKIIKFNFSDIVKIKREGKTIYQLIEE